MFKRILVFICVCIITLSGIAQDTISTRPITWDLATCLEYARKNNIQLRTLRYNELLSEQDYLLSKAARYPNLSASLTQSVVNSKNANPVVGGFQTQANASGNYGLNSSWTIYNGGYVTSNI